MSNPPDNVRRGASIVIGAITGALILLGTTEMMRRPADAQTPTPTPTPPPTFQQNNPGGTGNQQFNAPGGTINVHPPPPSPHNSGILAPPHDAVLLSPDNPTGTRLEIGKSQVIIESVSNEIGRVLFPLLSESQLYIERIDGKLKLSTKITDENGNLMAEIQKNEWKLSPPPNTWDRNYRDDALEVIDSKGLVVLQVRMLPSKIQLQGALGGRTLVTWEESGYLLWKIPSLRPSQTQ
jgi:hypothetical protein